MPASKPEGSVSTLSKPKRPKTAIIKTEQQLMTPVQFVQGLITDLDTIRRYIQSALKPDVDYGTIPGIDRKFLLRPGAEKCAKYFRARVKYEINEEKMEGNHISIIARARLISMLDEKEVAEGPYCSCTTMESNFRYRWVQPICPACAAIDKKCAACQGKGFYIPTKDKQAELKTFDMGKWKPEKAKDGTVVGWKWFERRDNPNIFDEHNKVRQMACKRALVKVVREHGCLSEIFTEDPSEWAFEDAIDVQTESQEKPTGRVIMEEKAPESPPDAQERPKPASQQAQASGAGQTVQPAPTHQPKAQQPAKTPPSAIPASKSVQPVSPAKQAAIWPVGPGGPSVPREPGAEG